MHALYDLVIVTLLKIKLNTLYFPLYRRCTPQSCVVFPLYLCACSRVFTTRGCICTTRGCTYNQTNTTKLSYFPLYILRQIHQNTTQYNGYHCCNSKDIHNGPRSTSVANPLLCVQPLFQACSHNPEQAARLVSAVLVCLATCTRLYNAVQPLCNFLAVVFTLAVVRRCTVFAERLAQARTECTQRSCL